MFFISRQKRHMVREKIINILDLKKTLNNLRNDNNKLEQEIKYLRIKLKWLQCTNGKLLLPGRNTEYDLVFAIGSTCHITTILDYFKLRRFSTPLEWTGGEAPENWCQLPDIYRDTRFREKIDAICNNFSEYMIPKDFQYVSEWTGNKVHHNVVNMRTHIRFLHHFPIDKSIEEYMPTFVETMQRRAKNLQDALKKSNKILICWLSTLWEQRAILENPVSDNDIKYAIKCLNKKFPNKQIDFVFFEHDGRLGHFEFERKNVTPDAVRIKSNHFLYDDEYDFKCVFDKKSGKHHLHVVSECFDNIKLSENAYVCNKNE